MNGAELTSGDEETECFYEFVPGFVKETGYLPIECRTCYKALIFWPYSKSNVDNFMKMLESLPVPMYGKYNEAVVVFYFKGKDKMLIFLDVLRKDMNRFGVEGRIQWRVSGQYWQDSYPEFFCSDKALKPVHIDTEITMKEWLKRQKRSIILNPCQSFFRNIPRDICNEVPFRYIRGDVCYEAFYFTCEGT